MYLLDSDHTSLLERGGAEGVNIRSRHEQKSDFTFWQSQPIEARLAALEQIRRIVAPFVKIKTFLTFHWRREYTRSANIYGQLVNANSILTNHSHMLDG